MEILRYPHPQLSSKGIGVADFNGREILEFSQRLYKTMIENDGIGLAATQVGAQLKMFVSTELEHKTIINPKWKPSPSGFKYKVIEGCLSFPGWLFPIERYDAIQVTYHNIFGEVIKRNLQGLKAQVFQHESDHLDGKTILDHLSEKQRKTILNYYKRI